MLSLLPKFLEKVDIKLNQAYNIKMMNVIMKKIFVFFIIFVLFCCRGVFAEEYGDFSIKNVQNEINKIGFRILNSNEIEYRMIFRYDKSNIENSFFDSKSKTVYISESLLNQIDSEDELAAAIAYQIARGLRYYEEKNVDYTDKLFPQKYEAYADKRAVDFIVNAGYSPLAMITLLNKLYGQFGDKKSCNKTKTSVRLAKIYEYIVRKYPNILEDDKFSNNIYYQNFLLTSRYNRELLQNKLKHEPYSAEELEYR